MPARRASAASRPSRSPTRPPDSAGSRPSGRSITSRSTVRAVRSAAEIASASSRSTGVSTTSHSGRTPRVTASTGSKARARSSHATIPPPACASAATRSATVVLPDDASPRSATVAERGSPPVARMASSAPNPVDTMRPSVSGSGVRRRGPVAGTSGADSGSGRPVSSGTSTGIGARASAPSTPRTISPPRRGAAAPQRAWSVASASETSDAWPIGRPIIERMFDMVKGRMTHFGRSDRRHAAGRRRVPEHRFRARPVLHFAPGRAVRRRPPGGDVAQLGERRVRIAEARGSSPLISTISCPARAGHDHVRGSVGQVVSPRVCKVLGQGSVDPTFVRGPKGLLGLNPELIPVLIPIQPARARPERR